MSRDEAYLVDMLGAARRVMRHIAGIDRQQFQIDELRQDGVIRAIQTIGEAANNVSDVTRQAHAEIPWRVIIAMRHHLVHAYWDIDLTLVWQTATEKVPELIAMLEPLVQPSETE